MFLRSLVVALTLAASAQAQTFPDPLSDTLSDFADVLDATEEGRITRLLADIPVHSTTEPVDGHVAQVLRA